MNATKVQDQIDRTKISRRAALTGAAGLTATATLGLTASGAWASEGPGVRYMQRISGDLYAAAHGKSPSLFLRAINRHADIKSISDYSLGQYSKKLNAKQQARMERGVAGFMSRYFASQVESYPVDRAEIKGERSYSANETLVSTRIFLKTGSSYWVEWLLAEHGKSFKIRDVRIMGFWLSPFQRSLFVSYIDKNGGDVSALLSALRV
jgi:phospholipid transport system substrate-binding protein